MSKDLAFLNKIDNVSQELDSAIMYIISKHVEKHKVPRSHIVGVLEAIKLRIQLS